MSELTLRDVELAGEYKIAGRSEKWIGTDGKVNDGPTSSPWPIVRPIPHDGHWAERQMEVGKKVTNPGTDYGSYYFFNRGLAVYHYLGRGESATYMSNREFWTRTDWEICGEPAKEKPIRDRVTESTTKAELAEVIADLCERVAKLEAR
ncbi:MAG: hypothetical protein WC655_16695 [Candidatus Hydrogenedentales bacterium]|jgi:hypothetical protein